MKSKKIGVLFCALTFQAVTTTAIADWRNEDGSEDHSWYLGAGLGITELDPDTNNTGYSVTDDKDSGFKLFGGYDFSERLTVEGFYADLGSAQVGNHVIKPDGAIDYSTLGVSALWYFLRNGENKGKNLRKGLQAYVHGGLSTLSNSSNVGFDQTNSVQVQYGAGVEYGFDNGIAMRAGIDLYDKDAGMAFISVMKRFGVKPKSNKVVEPVSDKVPVAAPVIEEAAPSQSVVIPAVAVTYDIDTDKDGVVDRLDACADSPKGIDIDAKGCSIIEFDFGDINFEPKSYELTKDSKQLLDEAVITINTSPELQKIEIQAHTDYKGSGDANLKLSELRAQSVKDYLVSQGVIEKRLIAKGYGESQPIADNKTEEGRAKNRRVELKVIKDDVTEINAE